MPLLMVKQLLVSVLQVTATIHNIKIQRENNDTFIDIKKAENWNDPKTARFYAKHVLCNQPSLTSSVADINKIFNNVTVKLRIQI